MIINVIIVAAIIGVLAVVMRYFKINNVQKETVSSYEIPKEPEFYFVPILKDVELIQNDQINDFSFDISSIIQDKDAQDILLTFSNNSTAHVRIEFIEILFVSHIYNKSFVGDSSYKDLTMGTNDIILKNTIISGGNLVRNIIFKTSEKFQFSGKDEIIIKLYINNIEYTLSQNINNSKVKEVKVI